MVREIGSPTLANYYYEGVINATEKDTFILLTESFLINFDELENLSNNQTAAFKHLITKSSVKLRRPYAAYFENYPRRASFVGSVNGNDFLNDPSGSRRFLCFDILEKIQNTINMDNVFSQAYTLLKEDFRFWFTKEEEEIIQTHNKNFTRQTIEEQLIERYVKPASESQEHAEFFTATMLLNFLNVKYGLARSNRSLQRIGKALGKANFTKTKRNGVYGYLGIIEKN